MLKKSIWNTIVQIGGKGITVLISLLTTGIITRKLGVTNYGYFILITSLFVFLDALSDFGEKTIGIREVAKGKRVMGNLLRLKLITTGLSWILGLAAIWIWNGFAGIRVEATIALSMVWLTSLFGIGEILFQSKLMMEKKVLVDVLFPLLFLTAIVAWGGPVNLMWVFVVYLVARIISMVPGWLMIRKYKEISEELNPSALRAAPLDKGALNKLWQETWPMGIFLIMFAAYDRVVDSMLIQHFIGANQVAFYGLAYKVYGVLIQPAYFYVNSIFPIMSSNQKGKRRIFMISLGLIAVGMVGIIGGVTILAPWMINILAGSEYAASATVLRILVWGCAFTYFGHLIGFTLIARGGQKKMLTVGIIGLIFNVIANLILIPRQGMYGAAKVTVATEAVDLILMGYFLWKQERKA
jgi:O-antigen/teichoic acid export membrane protein